MKYLAMTLASLSWFTSSIAVADPTKARSDVLSVDADRW